MTVASDNIFPKIILSEDAAPASPSAGDFKLYVDSSDHLFKMKNSSGTVTTFGSGIADMGTATYFDFTTGSAPASPSAGKVRLYSLTGDHLYQKDSGGTATALDGAAGGGGAVVLLEQHTASTSASLDFTTAISATYDEYMIEIVRIVPATNATNLLMRMSTDGGSSYDSGSNYSGAGFRFSNSGSAVSNIGGTSINLSSNLSQTNTSTKGFSASLKLQSPGSTSLHKSVYGDGHGDDGSGSPDIGIVIGGKYLSTTAVDAFQFLMSSGNIASGTIRVYGIAKT